ncbi:unnamed protein product, partial [Discosporangium mesarthrocarpum]
GVKGLIVAFLATQEAYDESAKACVEYMFGGDGSKVMLEEEMDSNLSKLVRVVLKNHFLSKEKEKRRKEEERKAKEQEQEKEVQLMRQSTARTSTRASSRSASSVLWDLDREREANAVLFQYPPEKRALDRISVTANDMLRTQEGEFLNDSLVDLKLKYMQREGLLAEMGPHDSAMFQVLSSHFFTKLREGSQYRFQETYNNVKSWTKNMDLFSKKFVLVPIAENLHWSMAVLVNLHKLKAFNGKYPTFEEGEEHPCMLFLDSLKMHRPGRVFDYLSKYLEEEWRASGKGGCLKLDESSMPRVTPKVPLQDNGCDCGVYILRYAQELCRQWPKICKEDVENKLGKYFYPNLFSPSDVSMERAKLASLLEQCRDLYKQEQEKERKSKAKPKSRPKAQPPVPASDTQRSASATATSKGNTTESDRLRDRDGSGDQEKSARRGTGASETTKTTIADAAPSSASTAQFSPTGNRTTSGLLPPCPEELPRMTVGGWRPSPSLKRKPSTPSEAGLPSKSKAEGSHGGVKAYISSNVGDTNTERWGDLKQPCGGEGSGKGAAAAAVEENDKEDIVVAG